MGKVTQTANGASGLTARNNFNNALASVDTGDVTDSAITFSKIQDISTTDKLLGRATAGAGVVEEITLTAAGRALIDDTDASAQRTTMGVVIGTDVQVFGAVLDDFNTLGAAASDSQIIVATGAGAFAYESGTTLRTSIGCKKVGKETLWIPATGMTPATTSGAATGQIETTTNKINIETLDFDATADEFAHFNIAMPKSWNLGTLTYQAFWSTTAVGTTGVAWALQAVAVADGDVIDIAYGTAIVVTDDVQSVAGDTLVTVESAEMTIAGSPADNEMCYFRLFRDVSDANDDMTEDAQLLGIKLHFTLDAEDDV